MVEDKTYLADDGLEEYKKEIEILKDKLYKINTEKSEACSGAIGDGWHDNFAYEDAKRQEDKIVAQINSLVSDSNYIEIVNDDEYYDNKVNINDIIELKFKYEDGSTDVNKFKLTGNWKSKDCDEYQEITLNSPLGKAIYMKELKSKVEYTVNDKLIVVDILKKIM